MEHFVIIVNGLQSLTIVTKHSIVDVAAVLDPPLIRGNRNSFTEIHLLDVKTEIIWDDPTITYKVRGARLFKKSCTAIGLLSCKKLINPYNLLFLLTLKIYEMQYCVEIDKQDFVNLKMYRRLFLIPDFCWCKHEFKNNFKKKKHVLARLKGPNHPTFCSWFLFDWFTFDLLIYSKCSFSKRHFQLFFSEINHIKNTRKVIRSHSKVLFRFKYLTL